MYKRYKGGPLTEVRVTPIQSLFIEQYADRKGAFYKSHVTMGGIIIYTELTEEEISEAMICELTTQS